MRVPDREIRSAGLNVFDLLSRASSLVGERYWLLLGITSIGFLIGQLVPFAIMLGPMMCGIHYVLRKQEAGEEFEFADLFRGLDWFAPSLLAALSRVGILLVVIIPCYLLALVPMMLITGSQGSGGEEEMFLMFGVFGVVYLLIAIVMWIVYSAFFYAFPLIMDRGLSTSEAIGASLRGFRRNIFGTLGVTFGLGVLMFLGTCCCYVGLFFLLPHLCAATWLAYRAVYEELPVAAAADPLDARG